MSYKIEKPLSIEERANFIVEYNHNQDFRIEETDLAMYALEPWEKLEGDEVVDNREAWEAEQEQKERERIQELSMTRGDLFEALILAQGIGKAQLRTMIENFEGLTDIERALYLNRFDEALDFYRKHPAIDLVGGLLGITPENMDKFFDTKDYTYLQVKTNEEIG